jgi:DNA-binding IclR family transcriptional regulator
VPSRDSKAKAPAGAQTLARGLTALELIAEAPEGLSIQEAAERLDVHRTVAARLLATLEQFHLVTRHEGRFRPAAGLAVLGASFDNHLRELSVPVLRRLADGSGATASLLVGEGEEQVAVAVIPPAGIAYHLSFSEGSRYPIDRGSGGMALQASRPPREGERELITETREKGWVMTHGEAEPDVYGLAVPVRRSAPHPATCINLVSHRPDLLERARKDVSAAARELAGILA